MPKSIPVSLRISEDDSAFISSLDMSGAITPSEKIRALIQESRRYHEMGNNSERIADQMQEKLRNLQENLLIAERNENTHSEFIRFVLDWNSQFIRTVLREHSKNAPSKTEIESFEETVAAQIFQLIDYVARLGLTPTAPCYNPKVIREKLGQHMDLLHLVEDQVRKGNKNG